MQAQLSSARAALAAAATLVQKAEAGRAAQQVKAESDILLARNGLQIAWQKRDTAAVARDSAVSETAADIKTAEQGVTKATTSLEHAKKTLADLETLEKVGGVSRNDLESARMQVSLAQIDLDAATAGVNRIKNGPGGVPFRVALARADVTAAEQGVQQAESAVRTALAARDKAMAVADSEVHSARASAAQARAAVKSSSDAVTTMCLNSPLDGITSSVTARVGETAQPGSPLVTVVSLKNLRIEALVPARNIPGLRVGLRVSINADTQPGSALHGVVSEIAKVAERDQRTIKVRFRLIGGPNLRPGLGARITFDAR